MIIPAFPQIFFLPSGRLIWISPLSGFRNPQIHLKSTLFPQPLYPTNPMISPSLQEKLTLSKTLLPEKVLDKFSALIISVLILLPHSIENDFFLPPTMPKRPPAQDRLTAFPKSTVQAAFPHTSYFLCKTTLSAAMKQEKINLS